MSAIVGIVAPPVALRGVHAQEQQQSQRIVEDVEVTGNRRLRGDDILYYVQTRKGDPYNEAQVQRDLQAILGQPFFDKTETSVSIRDGEKGGVIVTFKVLELPIIRDIQFNGLKSVTESDVLKAFRENRIGVSKESTFDPVKVRNATRVIKELEAAKGHPNAIVEYKNDAISQTSTALTFNIKEGDRVRVVKIEFEGNEHFSDGALRGEMKFVKEAGLISRFKSEDVLDRRKLDEDLRRVRFYMTSKGYLNARIGEPRIEGLGRRTTGFFIPLPLLSSTDEALRVTVPITEGKLYRIGEIKIEGNSIFSQDRIRDAIGLKPGEIADGQRIGKSLFEDLKKAYGAQGFIQYSAEPTPTFRDDPKNPNEGIADFTITIDEGKQFTLRRLEFLGNTFTRDNVLRREIVINEGDVYNQALFEFSVLRLNQLGYFDPIDKERDADFRTNEEEATVDVNVKVAERGRQSISFNGGISGIGGSFFGLTYSTNNLLGRGEVLSIDVAAGNRQRTLQFSFTEPYLRNRPITTGFSLFTSSAKTFGEGTALSQNVNALQGTSGSLTDFFNTREENLFTRTSNGGSIFASAPLSEFYRKRPFTQSTRIGLSYTIRQDSVREPTVNAENNAQTFIPVLYTQPNILTSRITPTVVYDTRDFSKNQNDPVRGKQISASFTLSGLGGDVRSYQPSLSYIQFIPVRNKKPGGNPHVFGFRLIAANVGSFATSSTIRNSNSLAFVNGVPIFDRFFLGDEFTIRGYNVRSITPYAPINSFITSRNVVLATNATGTPETPAGLPAALAAAATRIGTFTGATGSNVLNFANSITPIGGDTQLLGNFEYRVPIFGPASAAAFADIGSAFNLRGGRDQFINTNFVSDQPFLQTLGLGTNLSLLAARNNPNLAFAFDPQTAQTALILRGANFATRDELSSAQSSNINPQTGLPFGFQPVFLRGEAQTNTVVRINQSMFNGISDYRASLGVELRVQVPVVNVPFRLIYAYNPNARPEFFSGERRRVFRFSIGRTF
ncbi:MAG: outer membrane protein assembly factor BamA [Pyrinomonadaceae bacterium]